MTGVSASANHPTPSPFGSPRRPCSPCCRSPSHLPDGSRRGACRPSRTRSRGRRASPEARRRLPRPRHPLPRRPGASRGRVRGRLLRHRVLRLHTSVEVGSDPQPAPACRPAIGAHDPWRGTVEAGADRDDLCLRGLGSSSSTATGGPDLRGNKVLPTGRASPRFRAHTGDDERLRLARESRDATVLAGLWPDAQLLDIGGALHGAALWACGPQREQGLLGAAASPRRRATRPCPTTLPGQARRVPGLMYRGSSRSPDEEKKTER